MKFIFDQVYGVFFFFRIEVDVFQMNKVCVFILINSVLYICAMYRRD